MPAAPEPSEPSAGDLEFAADQAIAACGGEAREAVKALLVAIDFLEAQADELRAAVSKGYSRGRHGAKRNRKERLMSEITYCHEQHFSDRDRLFRIDRDVLTAASPLRNREG